MKFFIPLASRRALIAIHVFGRVIDGMAMCTAETGRSGGEENHRICSRNGEARFAGAFAYDAARCRQ